VIDISRLLAESFVAHAEHHEALDSTQLRARALAAAGVKLPALVVADRQTAGRGRGNNRWWTGEGALAFSLLIDPAAYGLARQAAPRLSLAAGVAVVDALAGRLDGHTMGLHWPNDVYADGRKLAGVLVEVLPDGRHIIGVGLNSNNRAGDAPEALRDGIATLLDLTGMHHDETELLLALLENLDAALAQLGQPLERLGERFDLLCLQRGTVLTVYQGEQVTTGRCAGIGVDGALLLETANGRVAVYSGTLQRQGVW
jgi:BirA family biotin operon repressor/biotin-[acetyl-CoA-carboxylase] ligase